MAEDEASLQAQFEELQARRPVHEDADVSDAGPKRRRCPKRQVLPEHLRREARHEPADTNCPSPGCGRPMVRVGEDVSERLDIVPAELFVHRHVYGTWACRCCQCLVQEAAVPHIAHGRIRFSK